MTEDRAAARERPTFGASDCLRGRDSHQLAQGYRRLRCSAVGRTPELRGFCGVCAVDWFIKDGMCAAVVIGEVRAVADCDWGGGAAVSRRVGGRAARRGLGVWRWSVACTVMVGTLVVVVVGVGLAGARHRGVAALSATAQPVGYGLSSAGTVVKGEGLPVVARALVSRTLGASDTGFRVVHEGPHWRLEGGGVTATFGSRSVQVGAEGRVASLSVAGWGYGRRVGMIGLPRLGADGNRVSYRYPGLVSWYAAGPLGVEQGFTVPRRPAGRDVRPLTIALRVNGLRPRLTSTGHALVLKGLGSVVLREGGLSARDARGRMLRSWLQVSGNRILVRVADASARYPLRIDPLIQTGSLTPTGSQGNSVLGSIRVLGSTLAVVGKDGGTNAVYVFTKAAGGWINGASVAELTASSSGDDPGGFASVAISGQTIVASAPDANTPAHPQPFALSPGAVYVWQEPSGGWSGRIQQAATLVSSPAAGCTELSGLAVSGREIDATCFNGGFVYTSFPPMALLQFTEPSGGWSGTLHESAKLLAPAGKSLSDPVLSGTKLIASAGQPDAMDVFSQPAGGWSGTVTLTPSAVLAAPRPVYEATQPVVSGKTVFVGSFASQLDHSGRASIYAFKQPPHGWSGTVHPTATLKYPSSDLNSGPFMAASGRGLTIANTNTYAGLGPMEHGCPCRSWVRTFTEPTYGWSGTISPQSSHTLVTNDLAGVDMKARTVFVTEGTSIAVLTYEGLPTASHYSMDGFASGHPRIGFRLVAGSDAPPMRSLRIGLPKGLRFIKSTNRLGEALAIPRAGGYTLRRNRGSLIVDLKRGSRALTVSVKSPGIIETTALRNDVSLSARRRHIRIHIVVTDTANHTTNLWLKFRLR